MRQKITGSEGNADVFVNVLSGHNIWTNCDCRSCEYERTIIYHTEGGYSCDAEEGYKCPEGTYQTRVVITVLGDLRDREKEQTKREYKDFYNYVKKECDFYVRNKTVKIVDN